MENSGQIFFEEDDIPQWFVALGSRWVGPMTAADVYEKILSHQLSWAHYVWRQGQADWRRICDTKTFQVAVPNQPEMSVQKAVREAIRPSGKQVVTGHSGRSGPPQAPLKADFEQRIWYLYYNDSQFGPFSQEELQRFLAIGKIHGRVHTWREGMKNWERIEKVAAFQVGVPLSQSASSVPPIVDHRSAPRRPLVAKILISDEQTVIVGVCRDISIGGMQVLTQQVPAKVGAKLKMNISPSTNESGKPIDSFVAKGVIVRILEDGRGFSFRFEQLSERARQAIESFIDSPA